MRMTQLFTRTLKQAPAGEVARNAQLGAAYFDTWQWFNLSNT